MIFRKSNDSVENDIPRVVNGKLCFGHWSDRHNDVVGQEMHHDNHYVILKEGIAGQYWMEFPDISGSPTLKVIAFSGRVHNHWPSRSRVAYKYAHVDVDGWEFAINIDDCVGVPVPEAKWSKVDREWVEGVVTQNHEREQRWAVEKAQRKAAEAEYLAAAKAYKPTRQERRWISRYVNSSGKKSYDQVRDILWDKFRIHLTSPEQVMELFGE